MELPDSDSEGEGAPLEFWCYIDPKGKIRGPFPSSKMLRWRAFFFNSTLVWRYGSKKPITFEEFLRLHKIHPLWTYFDEENEPLIKAKGTGDSDSDSCDEEQERKIIIPKNNQKAHSDGAENSNSSEASENDYEQMEEVHEDSLLSKVSPSKGSHITSPRKSFSDAGAKSSADSEKYQDADDALSGISPLKKDIDVDVAVTDNLPDRYELFGNSEKVKPLNPLDFTLNPKDKKKDSKVGEKENIVPIEEIQPVPMYPQNTSSAYQMPPNWYMRQQMGQPQQQQYTQYDQTLSYYRAVPPPPIHPMYITTPPPVWPICPIKGPHTTEQHLPPSHYYANQAQPIPPHMDARSMPYTQNNNYRTMPMPQFQQPPPPHQYYPQQQPYAQNNQTYHQQPYQPGAVQDVQVFKQSYATNNDNSFNKFSENLVNKYINYTGTKLQELYNENQKLKMHNEQLQQKKPNEVVQQKKPKFKPVSNNVSFAKMVSMDKDNDKKKEDTMELKSFWDNVPPSKSTSVPYKKGVGFIDEKVKKGNKYPAGYVDEGIKKKKFEPLPLNGVDKFIDWCLDTLNYVSENKLNVEGLRVVLQDFETIACVERYIKMWLDDFNPKMWVLFNEKLKKFRKEGMSDELNSPARANPYDIERTKQKEKIQKKAELFPPNKDLNTININRHLTKIHGKK